MNDPEQRTDRTLGGVTWQCDSELPDDFLAAVPALFAGHQPPANCRAITWGSRKKALFWEDRYIVKQYRCIGSWERLRSRFQTPPAQLELRRGRAVADRGIPTVVPVAAGTERRCGRVRRSFVVVKAIPGARDLEACLASDPTAEQRRIWIAALATLTRQIHDAGVYQYDFNPSNFLVDPENHIFLIDMGRVSFHRRVGEQDVVENLARLLRGVRHLGIGSTDALRFFRAYLGTTGPPTAHERDLAQRVLVRLEQLLRRREGKVRRACMRSGRNFYRLSATHGETRVAILQTGEDRLSKEALAELLEALEGGQPLDGLFGDGWQLAATRLANWTDAVAAWRRLNVEQVRRRSTTARPRALVLATGGSYLVTVGEPTS